ncbi:hypothetical protein [Longispora albida]|uniref:hypothetical protein n=1 Tax=Longispora albida TaxID=203523 RepID=UPI00036F1575|nr:hypothetical protein [Longispora albida]
MAKVAAFAIAAVLSAVAALALFLTTPVTPVASKPEAWGGGDGGPPPVPGTRPTASPGKWPESARRDEGLPHCLIGAWVTADWSGAMKFYSDRPEIPFTGTGTSVQQLRPDGTGTEATDKYTFTGTFEGSALKVVQSGSHDFTWKAAANKITYVSVTRRAYTVDWYRDGTLINSSQWTDTGAFSDPEFTYACNENGRAEISAKTPEKERFVRSKTYGYFG